MNSASPASVVLRRPHGRAGAIVLMLAAALCAGSGPAAGEPTGRTAVRNILLIVADDMGWGDLGIHGNRNVRTPRLDQLAREGARFERFYAAPVCSPTRAALLTGRWAPLTGVRDVSRGGERLNLSETTLADLLHASGFATGAFGKWHNGAAFPYHPNGRGFDVFDGFCCGHWAEYFDPVLERNGVSSRRKGFITDLLTDSALSFLRENARTSFFCYVAYNVPHSPFQVPDADYERVRNRPLPDVTGTSEDLATTRSALAMVENMDHNIGRLLDELAALRLDQQTLVIFLSDNGPNSRRWNGGLRGIKGSIDEGGTRVPCLMRLPNRIAAGVRVAQPAADIDLLPTICAMADIEAKTAHEIAGRNLAPLLSGDGASAWPDRLIATAWNGRLSVRDSRYWDDGRTLYDLVADPGQQTNLAKQLPELHARLASECRALAQQAAVVPPAGVDEVGHVRFPAVLLPVQDAGLSPDLRFSSRHPNTAWVTDWTGTTASVTWQVKVATASCYRAELLYTCNAAATGTAVSLAAAQSAWTGTIRTVWNPPLRPQNDRVPRTESPAKDFHATDLGVQHLEAGPTSLRLTLPEMPAGAIVDVAGIRISLQTNP